MKNKLACPFTIMKSFQSSCQKYNEKKRLNANWIAAILYEIKFFKIGCLRSSGVPVGPKKKSRRARRSKKFRRLGNSGGTGTQRSTGGLEGPLGPGGPKEEKVQEVREYFAKWENTYTVHKSLKRPICFRIMGSQKSLLCDKTNYDLCFYFKLQFLKLSILISKCYLTTRQRKVSWTEQN